MYLAKFFSHRIQKGYYPSPPWLFLFISYGLLGFPSFRFPLKPFRFPPQFFWLPPNNWFPRAFSLWRICIFFLKPQKHKILIKTNMVVGRSKPTFYNLLTPWPHLLASVLASSPQPPSSSNVFQLWVFVSLSLSPWR